MRSVARYLVGVVMVMGSIGPACAQVSADAASQVNARPADAAPAGLHFQACNLAKQPAYTVINASIGWTTPDNRCTFSLYGENINNAHYGIYLAFGTNGTAQAWGRPRQIGVKLDVNV